ncbi:MAG TPA: hypothetical protein VHV75_14035 [Solirubrobacteraceae bacterium]|jgi:uncharacterized protein YciI|nr:hypothetical protein [Solirubrobacteraceae bacterium]
MIEPEMTYLLLYKYVADVLEAWADTDPYVIAGLVVERVVEPWKLV